MSMKIYVGNLAFQTNEEGLRSLFAQHGEVQSASVITDRDTGRSRGFGFVEMEDSAATAAIEALNETDFEGRTLRISEARQRENRGGGSRW